jgi:hypothetical protein
LYPMRKRYHNNKKSLLAEIITLRLIISPLNLQSAPSVNTILRGLGLTLVGGTRQRRCISQLRDI